MGADELRALLRMEVGRQQQEDEEEEEREGKPGKGRKAGKAGKGGERDAAGVSEADLEALLDRTDLEAGKPIVATKGPGYEVVARGTGAGILSGVNA